MANVTYFIRSEKEKAPIYLQFSTDRTLKFKKKTREFVNSEHWSGKMFAKGTPKNIKSGTAQFLNDHNALKERLKGLESFILKEYGNRTDEEIINGDWLDEVINGYYNGGKRTVPLDNIADYLNHYEKNILPFRKYRGQPITTRTAQKQITIISKFQDFLKTEKKTPESFRL